MKNNIRIMIGNRLYRENYASEHGAITDAQYLVAGWLTDDTQDIPIVTVENGGKEVWRSDKKEDRHARVCEFPSARKNIDKDEGAPVPNG